MILKHQDEIGIRSLKNVTFLEESGNFSQDPEVPIIGEVK